MDGYQSIFNSSSLIANSSDIIFSDISPDSILYVNSTLNPAGVTLGANLSFSGGTLTLASTITGLTSVSSTTFIGSLTGNASTATSLSTSGSANQFWTYNNSWATITQAMITGLKTSDSPTFAGLTLSSPLSYANGGTGQSTYAKGDIVYASAINTLSKLTIGSANQVLSVNGSGVPTWTTIGSGVTSLANTDSNITLSASTGAVTINLAANLLGLSYVQSGSFIGTLTGNATGLTGGTVGTYYSAAGWAYIAQSDITGLKTSDSPTFAGLTLSSPLSYANGGTGQSTYAKGDIVYASAINTLSKLTIGSANQVLITNGSSVPAWSNLSSIGVTSVSAGNSNITVSPTTGAVVVTLSNTPSITDLSLSGTLMMSGFQSDTSFGIGRSFTATGATAYSIVSNATLTTASGAAFRSAYGLMMMNTFASNTSNTPVVFYNIFSYPAINATAATVGTAYSGYFAFNSGSSSGTITNSYSLNVDAPGIGTNRVSIYTNDIQVGGSLLSGTSKTGFAYIDSRLSVGGSTNNADNTLIVNRSFTTSAISATIASFTGSITAYNAASGISMYAMGLTNTLISSASNTAATYVNLYSQPTINATASTVTTVFGIYSAIPAGSGTVTNSYSGFFGLPSTSSTNKSALYTESIYCAASGGAPGVQTAGNIKCTGDVNCATVTASGTITGNNLNLSGFTFRSSLACAAQAVSGSWKGMNSTVASTHYYSRFGFLIMVTIPKWNYPNSSTTQTPYFDANPGGWAPTANTLIPIIANHNNAYVQCCLLVNTNCTIYLYGPQYSNKIRMTNAGSAFPEACNVSWACY